MTRLPRIKDLATESSGTGLQTTRLREDARDIIRAAVDGDDDSVVLFAGSGCTGAIAKLIGVLGLRIPSVLDDRYALSEHIPTAERPVVFLGPYEHHSNEIPWRESIADVVTIRQDADGVSAAFDGRGRVLATADSFGADRQTLVADVPVRGATTPYDRIGDLFAWLCLATVPLLAALATARSRRR